MPPGRPPPGIAPPPRPQSGLPRPGWLGRITSRPHNFPAGIVCIPPCANSTYPTPHWHATDEQTPAAAPPLTTCAAASRRLRSAPPARAWRALRCVKAARLTQRQRRSSARAGNIRVLVSSRRWTPPCGSRASYTVTHRLVHHGVKLEAALFHVKPGLRWGAGSRASGVQCCRVSLSQVCIAAHMRSHAARGPTSFHAHRATFLGATGLFALSMRGISSASSASESASWLFGRTYSRVG